MTANYMQSHGLPTLTVDTRIILQKDESSLQSSSCSGNIALKRYNTNSQEKNTNKQKFKGIFCTIETCGERFANAGLLELHNKIHNGVKPFICDICNKVCKTESKLIVHKSSHANDGIRPLCDICNRSFSSQSALNKHKKILHKPKPYLCHVCKAGFEKHEYMMIHAKREHGIEVVEIYEEDGSDPLVVVDEADDVIQDSSHKSHSYLIKHAQTIDRNLSDKPLNNTKKKENTENNSENIKFLCKMCTSTFPSQHYLEQHMAVHIAEKSESHIPLENSPPPVNHMSVQSLNPYTVSPHHLKNEPQNYAISDSYSQHMASNRAHTDPGSFTFVSRHISHSVGISSLPEIKQSQIYGNPSVQGVITDCYRNRPPYSFQSVSHS